MKLKNIILSLTLLLVILLIVSTVNAVSDNETIVSLNQETDSIDMSCEINNMINQQENINNENQIVLSKNNDDKAISKNVNQEIPLKTSPSDKIIVIGYDDYKHYTVKYKKNTYFTVDVYDKNTYDPVKSTFKVKVFTGSKSKTYTIKSVIYEESGWIKIPTKNLKVGTHKVIITPVNNPYSTSFTTKIIVKDTKKIKKKTSTSKKTTKKKTTKKKNPKYKSVMIYFKSVPDYFSAKKLKTKDTLNAFFTYGGQYSKGVYVKAYSYSHKIHTKIKKVKFYFKSYYTNGKTISKTVKKVKNSKYSSTVKTGIKYYYAPYKAKVWYTKV